MEKLKDSDIDQAIIDEYEIGETLGTGHFSKVKLGINKKTGEKVAIKVRAKALRGARPLSERELSPLPPLRACSCCTDYPKARPEQDGYAQGGGGHPHKVRPPQHCQDSRGIRR